MISKLNVNLPTQRQGSTSFMMTRTIEVTLWDFALQRGIHRPLRSYGEAASPSRGSAVRPLCLQSIQVYGWGLQAPKREIGQFHSASGDQPRRLLARDLLCCLNIV